MTRAIPSVLCLGAALLVTGCSPAKKAVEVDQAKLNMFEPLPTVVESPKNPITDEKVQLGRMLYYEKRLSRGHDISCNSCHALDKYGVDGQQFSSGFKSQKGGRNSPTVFNAAAHIAQFWDGRAADVEEQAKGPVMNPVEMAMPSEKYVLDVLNSMPEYVGLFQKAFPNEKNPVTFDNMARAIGAFERRLLTPSRWDKFLSGDKAALTEEEKAGFNRYVETGCQQCHAGPLVGGKMFQKLGLAKPYPDLKDAGRKEHTKNEADAFMFKVPSLRNIEKTGPYFHDGSVTTLDEAVTRMGEYQLGVKLKPQEVAEIVAFLKTLTGEVNADYVREPTLPPSTPKTPKPQAI